MAIKVMKFVLLPVLLTILVIGGCNLVTGTFVIDLEIDHSEIQSHGTFEHFAVNLDNNDTWNQHKDKIKDIDNVGFQLWVTDSGASSIGWEVYADTTSVPHSDIASIKSDAKLILAGLTLPPGETYIDWPTSLIYLNRKELPIFKQWVEGGVFDIYTITDVLPYNVTIDSAKVIVTVTAGP